MNGTRLEIPHVLHVARVANGLSAEQAAELVASSKRSWDEWELGNRPMPRAKLLLFLRAISEGKRLVLLFRAEHDGMPRPIDALTEATFLEVVPLGAGTWLAKSIAVDRLTGLPYVHLAEFDEVDNRNSLAILLTWKSVVVRATENYSR